MQYSCVKFPAVTNKVNKTDNKKLQGLMRLLTAVDDLDGSVAKKRSDEGLIGPTA